ncbi:hypothetical protein Slin15195_G024210 [Septoria linicola]|uniref:F-box domain-containing protein n=1 Tax=Septoria linicola TaxID=215465 RepID=A0A9Q9AH58_9PEZI|nr:hypothetical protein Slin14017_G023300 [Septoria linicola]USW49102.1 hypothetical protein Slin15195_G024210 [Septoria linicola]
MALSLWDLPQEMRDTIYDFALRDAEVGTLPPRLAAVCQRMRDETRRLYTNATIREKVIRRYFEALSTKQVMRWSDSRFAAHDEQDHDIFIATPQSSKFAGVAVDLQICAAQTRLDGCRINARPADRPEEPIFMYSGLVLFDHSQYPGHVVLVCQALERVRALIRSLPQPEISAAHAIIKAMELYLGWEGHTAQSRKLLRVSCRSVIDASRDQADG